MSWYLARSLAVLRAEVNALAPRRSTVSDGTIGDPSHASTWSDHNPTASGAVCALDITHDPAGGADMTRISEHIRIRRHPALKYVIFNRRIASASSGWTWRTYDGANPHTRHMHVSVGAGPDGRSTGPYDDISPWGLTGGTGSMPDVRDIWLGGEADLIQRYNPDGSPVTSGNTKMTAGYALGFAAREVAGARRDIAAVRVEMAALRSVVESLADTLRAGGGSVDTAAILAAVDLRVTAAVAEVADELADRLAQ